MFRGNDPGENTDVTLAYCSRFETWITLSVFIRSQYIYCISFGIILSFNLWASEGEVKNLPVWLALISVVDAWSKKIWLEQTFAPNQACWRERVAWCTWWSYTTSPLSTLRCTWKQHFPISYFVCFRDQVGSSTNASLRALKKVAGNQFEVVLLSELAVIKDSSCDNVGTASPLCLRDVGHLAVRCFVLDF